MGVLNGDGGIGDRCVDGSGGGIGELGQMGGSKYLAGLRGEGRSMSCGCP